MTMANQGIELLLIGAELIAVTNNYRARLSQLRREHEHLVLNLQGVQLASTEHPAQYNSELDYLVHTLSILGYGTIIFPDNIAVFSVTRRLVRGLSCLRDDNS